MKLLANLVNSLSVRLLVTTALWVTFMVSAIAYTMGLSWEIERTAGTQSSVAAMPGMIYRANVLADKRFPEKEFLAQLSAFDTVLSEAHNSDGWGYLADSQLTGLDLIEREWSYVVEPLLLEARKNAEPIDTSLIQGFVDRLDALQESVQQRRERFLDIQRRLQILLMTLAVGSLFVIMFFLLRWVIHPTEELGAGLTRVCEGHLDTRVKLTGTSEFQSISTGFNRMIERLQDLVENLEAKVKEKTEAVEEQNRNLSQLYEVAKFSGQQHSIDELCEGFSNLLMQYTTADACAVFLLDSNRKFLELTASVDLPPDVFTRLSRNPVGVDGVEVCLKSDVPLRINSSMPEEFLSELRTSHTTNFKTSYVYHVRNGTKNIGLFLLYSRQDLTLSAQTNRLYETFGANLGVAVDNLRLIERDQQLAVIQERTLMAQGLHDSIAQSLSFLNLQVQLLEDGLKNDDKELVDVTVGQIKAGVQESYEDVRELLLNFRERLHKESFDEGIATVISRFEAQTKVKVRLVNSGSGAELADSQKLQVIFIMQEALANVRKHSKATEVLISIRNDNDFEMRISDNGVGIDEDILKQRRKRHVGLNIMKERAARIDAQVEVTPVDPKLFSSGTTVRLFIGKAVRRDLHA